MWVAAVYTIVGWIVMQVGTIVFPNLGIPQWLLSVHRYSDPWLSDYLDHRLGIRAFAGWVSGQGLSAIKKTDKSPVLLSRYKKFQTSCA